MSPSDRQKPDKTAPPHGPRANGVDRAGEDHDGDHDGDPLGRLLGKHAPRWLLRTRSHPATRPFYRAAVAVVGASMLILAALTGWLPGPGGIPLALLGLAILATEFHWARKILARVRVWLHWCGEHWRRIGGVLRGVLIGVLVAGLLGIVWAGLAVSGVPGWLPATLSQWLGRLPGVG